MFDGKRLYERVNDPPDNNSVMEGSIQVKLSKLGNSLRMTITKPVLQALGWKEGDQLEVGITDHSMIVKKVE